MCRHVCADNGGVPNLNPNPWPDLAHLSQCHCLNVSGFACTTRPFSGILLCLMRGMITKVSRAAATLQEGHSWDVHMQIQSFSESGTAVTHSIY